MIGALGRLDPNKRVDLTMEAAKPLLGERCKILVIGRGEDQARLEAAAERLGVTEHVIFGGYQSDTTAMLAGFDLYVAASLQETFGLSVLEALASGLPVLYTDLPGAGRHPDRAGPAGGRDRGGAAATRSARSSRPVPGRGWRTARSSSGTASSRWSAGSTTCTSRSWRPARAGSSERRRAGGRPPRPRPSGAADAAPEVGRGRPGRERRRAEVG